MESIIPFIYSVGFPVASAIGGAFFGFQTMRFIMKGLIDQIDALDDSFLANATKTTELNNTMAIIDIQISHIIGLKADIKNAVDVKPKGD